VVQKGGLAANVKNGIVVIVGDAIILVKNADLNLSQRRSLRMNLRKNDFLCL